MDINKLEKRRFDLFHKIKDLSREVEALSAVVQNPMVNISREELLEWQNAYLKLMNKLLRIGILVPKLHDDNLRNKDALLQNDRKLTGFSSIF